MTLATTLEDLVSGAHSQEEFAKCLTTVYSIRDTEPETEGAEAEAGTLLQPQQEADFEVLDNGCDDADRPLLETFPEGEGELAAV